MGYTVRPASPVIRPETPVIRPASPVIRPSVPVVRPEGDAGVPASLPGTPLVILYATNATGDAGSPERLATWPDASGNSNSPTAFSTTPPLLTTDGGVASVHFDDLTRFVIRASASGPVRTAVGSELLVYRKVNNTGTQVLMGDGSTASSTYRYQTNTTSRGINNGSLISEASPTEDTSAHCVIVTRVGGGGNDLAYIDGNTTPIISGNSGDTAADGWSLGRTSSGGNFHAFAYIIWGTTLSVAEMSQAYAYIKSLAHQPTLP